jgi:hypothetical protein
MRLRVRTAAHGEHHLGWVPTDCDAGMRERHVPERCACITGNSCTTLEARTELPISRAAVHHLVFGRARPRPAPGIAFIRQDACSGRTDPRRGAPWCPADEPAAMVNLMDTIRNLLGVLLTAILLLGCETGGDDASWPPPGARSNDIAVERTLVADCCFRGGVRSIQLVRYVDGELAVAVVPQTGLYLFDPATLAERVRIEFNDPDGSPRWFGLSPYLIGATRGFHIAMRGGGYGDVALLDGAGARVWTFGGDTGLPPRGMVVDDLAPGDLRLFVLDRASVVRLDAAGRVVWRAEEDAEHVTLVREADGDEAGFATASARGREIRVWSADGEIRHRIPLPFAPGALNHVRSDGVSGFVVRSGKREIAFVLPSGEIRFTYQFRDYPVRHGPTATLVRLAPGQPPVLAVRLAASSSVGRSVLTLLSLEGKMLYQEVMRGGLAVAAVPLPGEGRDRLLVGDGPHALWSYQVRMPH